MSGARFSLAGRCALVTGASRGIGAAIAVALAEAGADVALCARSAPDEVAERIEAAGRRALALRCDVTQGPQVSECVERAWAELGTVDVLVNNAGGPLFHAPVLDVRESGWQRVLDLNLTSVLRFSQLCGARMAGHGRGCVVNIASMPPTRAWPSIASYSAAKAGVLNLTASLAAELGPAGVRVNAICPGWIRTATNDVYLADGSSAATAVEGVPLGRWGEPDDVAGAALWLASDAACYVSGAVIPVDGGFSVGISPDWQRRMETILHDRRT